MTKAQGRALQDLQQHGDWATAWELGRQERVLNVLVELGKAERDVDCGCLGRTIVSYKAT